ncbi:MAG: DegT/DnrJ/EryC1/StrS family aminotransferase [Victivallales bacterium]|nr:DegT/DnrJ/EryC1/StrS family aminotransferase [Victivallales bacterium]
MKVPLLDLKPQYESLKEEIQKGLADLCATQMFILGPHIVELEEKVARYCQAGYGCAVSSGSDALLITMMAEGIGHGDEVITSPYTFFATAGAIARVGATPVFVDIDPITYNINPALIEAKITSRTKAIIPVHLYGQMADMEAIMEIAKRHGLVVIEDAAQSIGAECNGRRAGSIGDYGCLSFFPSKNLGGFGDAGMVVSNNKEKAHRVEILRNHGMEPKYHHHFIGGNFRMDALQAVILKIKLPYLDDWTTKRQLNAMDYHNLLADVNGIILPKTAPWTTRHVFNQFILRIPNGRRQNVWDALKKADIGCDVYYPIPLHLQPCFNYLGYAKGAFPESEKAADETLAIPIYPDLTSEQKQFVAATIKEALR